MVVVRTYLVFLQKLRHALRMYYQYRGFFLRSSFYLYGFLVKLIL